jgi:Zn-dependent metalloprotease
MDCRRLVTVGSLGVALGLFPALAEAGGPSDAVRRLRARSPSDVTPSFDRGRGIVSFVRAPGGVRGLTAGGHADRAAAAFLREFGGLFGLGHPGVTTPFVSVTHDHLGASHVEFAQAYEGLPVFGTSVRVHFDAAGDLVAAQAAFVPVIDLSVTPSFGEAEAVAVALDHVVGADHAVGAVPLSVFDLGLVTKDSSDPRLVYVVTVAGPGVRTRVFVDAHHGAVLLADSQIHDVLDRTVFDTEYGPGFQVWTEADGPYMGGDSAVAGVVDYTADTYALFDAVGGGYPSYDGASAVMEAVVHAAINCPNAQWNGTSTNYCSGVATDDVVGHEWAHAYSERTHNLIYAYQPGALNESYSDIFGESIDLLNGAGLDTPGETRNDNACTGGGGSVRWLIGEDTSGFGGAIRDMWAPTCMNAPGRVGDGEYVCTGDSFFDNGGVHSNSGVPNHAYALLVDGGNYNGEAIAPIGMTKALAVYWRAMTVYQGVVSGFADHADALEAACADLVGSGADLPDPLGGGPSGEIMQGADCGAVALAMVATQMRDDAGCGSGTLLQTGNVPDACDPATTEVVVFEETFEGDLSAWAVSNVGVAATYTPRDWELVGGLPDGRAGQAAFGTASIEFGDCDDDDQSGLLHLESPPFEMPEGDDDVVLEFTHWVATQPHVDGGNLEISVDGGPFVDVPGSAFSFNPYNSTLEGSSNPLAGEGAFSGSDPGVPTGSWARSQLDLSSLAAAGSTVVLRFDVGVDECNGLFGWYVDDVRAVQCSTAVTATGTGSDSGMDTTGDGTAPGTDTGAGATTGSASGIDDSGTGGGPGGGTPVTLGGTDDGSTSEGAADGGGGDDGCGCTSGRRGWRGGGLLLLVAAWRRRRRTAGC